MNFETKKGIYNPSDSRLKIHYRNDEVKKLYEDAGVQTSDSAGYDLICAEDVEFSGIGDFKIVDLGVIIKPMKGHHSLLIPRSSTFKKTRLLQANSVGLIDEDYCGEDDYWGWAVVYLGTEPFVLKKGTRVCQFIQCETVPFGDVEEFSPGKLSRGGFGSTAGYRG